MNYNSISPDSRAHVAGYLNEDELVPFSQVNHASRQAVFVTLRSRLEKANDRTFLNDYFKYIQGEFKKTKLLKRRYVVQQRFAGWVVNHLSSPNKYLQRFAKVAYFLSKDIQAVDQELKNIEEELTQIRDHEPLMPEWVVSDYQCMRLKNRQEGEGA